MKADILLLRNTQKVFQEMRTDHGRLIQSLPGVMCQELTNNNDLISSLLFVSPCQGLQKRKEGQIP